MKEAEKKIGTFHLRNTWEFQLQEQLISYGHVYLDIDDVPNSPAAIKIMLLCTKSNKSILVVTDFDTETCKLVRREEMRDISDFSLDIASREVEHIISDYVIGK